MFSDRHLDGRRRQSASGGFTLIEVLISVVVLSMGIVLVLQGMHGVLGVWDAAVERLRSVMLAREKLETARIEAALSATAPVDDGGRFDPPLERYRWRLETEPVSPSLRGGVAVDSLYGVRCTVRREDGGREFTAATLIYVPPDVASGAAP